MIIIMLPAHKQQSGDRWFFSDNVHLRAELTGKSLQILKLCQNVLHWLPCLDCDNLCLVQWTTRMRTGWSIIYTSSLICELLIMCAAEETCQGDGRKVRSSLRSTEAAVKKEEDETPTRITECVEAALFSIVYVLSDDVDSKIWLHQTRKIPVKSYWENRYIMVVF